MAVRRTRIAGEGSPIVSTYTFDEKYLEDSSFKVKVFDSPSLFIIENRKRNKPHGYDVVIGPIADDGVAFQLERYSRQMITLETLVKELTYRKLNRQFFFGTELSISKLQRLKLWILLFYSLCWGHYLEGSRNNFTQNLSFKQMQNVFLHWT